MTRFYAFFCLLFIPFLGFGQNQKTNDSLRYGHWKFLSRGKDHISEGTFKIVPLSAYDTVSTFLPSYNMGKGIAVVRYKEHKYTVFAYSSDSGKLSVKDGSWNYYDTTGTHMLTRVTCWEDGISTWTKKFDNIGNTTEYTYYGNDTLITLNYIDGRVFSKAFYVPGNDEDQIVMYYPFDNMHISNAAPEFDINFITHPTDEQPLVITVKEETTITSFAANSYISVLNDNGKPVKTPMKLEPGEKYAFSLRYAPGRSAVSGQDTMVINTNGKMQQYKIISSASLAHIDEHNLRDLKNLSLSISKDKYLYIKGCASETHFHITDTTGKIKYYDIHGDDIVRLSLKNIGTSADYMMVDMGDGAVVGSIKLDITK